MLFFIHIPKTAGTSIYDALQDMIPDRLARLIGPATAVQSFLSNPSGRRLPSVYFGHFGYHDIKPFVGPDDRIFSVIREPIERAFSTYNYILLRDKSHPLHPEIANRTIIEAVKASPKFELEINNCICRYLSGTRNFEYTKSIVTDKGIKLYTVDQLDLMI